MSIFSRLNAFAHRNRKKIFAAFGLASIAVVASAGQADAHRTAYSDPSDHMAASLNQQELNRLASGNTQSNPQPAPAATSNYPSPAPQAAQPPRPARATGYIKGRPDLNIMIVDTQHGGVMAMGTPQQPSAIPVPLGHTAVFTQVDPNSRAGQILKDNGTNEVYLWEIHTLFKPQYAGQIPVDLKPQVAQLPLPAASTPPQTAPQTAPLVAQQTAPSAVLPIEPSPGDPNYAADMASIGRSVLPRLSRAGRDTLRTSHALSTGNKIVISDEELDMIAQAKQKYKLARPQMVAHPPAYIGFDA